MKMFVANATKQNVNFLYRIPEQQGVRVQEIAIGAQVQLSGDLDRVAIDYIIEQHSRYGLIPADSVDRTRDFTGMCYSIDKPVDVGKIEKLIHYNVEKLVEQGKKIRQEAALSTSNALDYALDDAGGGSAPGVNKFEMSVVEENHDDRDDLPAIAEGVRVTRDEGQQSVFRTGRRKR